MNRRQFFSLITAGAVLGNLGITSRSGFAASLGDSSKHSKAVKARLRNLEAAAYGRLGVHILDTSTGQEYGYRSDERFMLLSTFKLLASALVLHRVDAAQDSLGRRIPYARGDLIDWSPITEKHADGSGMTLAELCEAAVTASDNTAANLILSSYGGPPAVTNFVQQLGDGVTRLDRTEPGLNFKGANSLWDTTSPRAMVHTLHKIVLGTVLSAPSRNQLQQWLLNNTTGAHRLRAGLPANWRIGEKTGTNRTSANDIGVIWPPNRAPIVVAAYLNDSLASAEIKESTLAAVGKLVADIVVPGISRPD